MSFTWKIAAAGSLILIAAGCADRPYRHRGPAVGAMAIYVREAPPARPAMRRPPRPSTIAVWIDGHWTWTGTQFVWTRGYWDRNPPRGKRWLPGRWRQSDRGWYWVPGEWR